jgi:uncharacterized membrane protein
MGNGKSTAQAVSLDAGAEGAKEVSSVVSVLRWEEQLGVYARVYQHLLLLLILALAASLRIFNIGARSVWYDESFSLILAGRDPATIFDATAHDYHPPLWYLILGVWERIFGSDLLSARMLSAFFGIAAVGLIFMVAKKLFGSRTALLAALIAACSPFEILYSQEVRMYSFEACLGALWLYVFYQAYRHASSWQAWAAFSLVSTIALYNLYFSVFGLAAFDLFFVVAMWSDWKSKTSRKKILGWLLANLASVILYIPWLVLMLGQVAKVNKSYWIDRPNILEFLRLFDIFLFNTTNLTVDPWLSSIGLLFSAISFVLILNRLRFKLRRGEKGRQRRSFEIALCLAYWFIPVALVFLISYLFAPIYLERSLIAFAAPVFILVARVIQVAVRPRRWLWFLVPALLIVVASLGYYYFSRFYTQHYELRQAAAYVEAGYQPGDIVVHSNKLSYLPFVYLQVPGSQFVIPEQPDSPHNDLSPQTELGIGLRYTPIAEVAANAGKGRIWVVVTNPQPSTDPNWWQHNGQEWLEQQHYRLLSASPDQAFWGETIMLYAPPT